MVEDGTVYAAAGLADHDGTFVYALDARTGAPKWQNADSGHMDGARNGVAVQGNLTIAAGRLWLAGGNQVGPASYDLETGKCLVQHAPPQLPHRQRGRNIAVFADEYIMNGGRLLYSGESNVISSANFDFFKLAANGAPSYPAAQLMQRSSTAPAWDEDTFVYLTSRYSQLVCWDTPKMKDLFDRRRQQALSLNQERAGMQKRRSAQQRFQRHAHQAKRWGPKNRDTLAIAVAANAVLTAGERPGDANGWAVYAFEKKTGDEMWRCELPAQPLLNGLAVDRKGRVLLALVDGSIVCFGTAR
jgi:outer membrane protein assembly factor BamB